MIVSATITDRVGVNLSACYKSGVFVVGLYEGGRDIEVGDRIVSVTSGRLELPLFHATLSQTQMLLAEIARPCTITFFRPSSILDDDAPIIYDSAQSQYLGELLSCVTREKAFREIYQQSAHDSALVSCFKALKQLESVRGRDGLTDAAVTSIFRHFDVVDMMTTGAGDTEEDEELRVGIALDSLSRRVAELWDAWASSSVGRLACGYYSLLYLDNEHEAHLQDQIYYLYERNEREYRDILDAMRIDLHRMTSLSTALGGNRSLGAVLTGRKSDSGALRMALFLFYQQQQQQQHEGGSKEGKRSRCNLNPLLGLSFEQHPPATGFVSVDDLVHAPSPTAGDEDDAGSSSEDGSGNPTQLLSRLVQLSASYPSAGRLEYYYRRALRTSRARHIIWSQGSTISVHRRPYSNSQCSDGDDGNNGDVGDNGDGSVVSSEFESEQKEEGEEEKVEDSSEELSAQLVLELSRADLLAPLLLLLLVEERLLVLHPGGTAGALAGEVFVAWLLKAVAAGGYLCWQHTALLHLPTLPLQQEEDDDDDDDAVEEGEEEENGCAASPFRDPHTENSSIHHPRSNNHDGEEKKLFANANVTATATATATADPVVGIDTDTDSRAPPHHLHDRAAALRDIQARLQLILPTMPSLRVPQSVSFDSLQAATAGVLAQAAAVAERRHPSRPPPSPALSSKGPREEEEGEEECLLDDIAEAVLDMPFPYIAAAHATDLHASGDEGRRRLMRRLPDVWVLDLECMTLHKPHANTEPCLLPPRLLRHLQHSFDCILRPRFHGIEPAATTTAAGVTPVAPQQTVQALLAVCAFTISTLTNSARACACSLDESIYFEELAYTLATTRAMNELTLVTIGEEGNSSSTATAQFLARFVSTQHFSVYLTQRE
jgi:hypothetical protein